MTGIDLLTTGVNYLSLHLVLLALVASSSVSATQQMFAVICALCHLGSEDTAFHPRKGPGTDFGIELKSSPPHLLQALLRTKKTKMLGHHPNCFLMSTETFCIPQSWLLFLFFPSGITCPCSFFKLKICICILYHSIVCCFSFIFLVGYNILSLQLFLKLHICIFQSEFCAYTSYFTFCGSSVVSYSLPLFPPSALSHLVFGNHLNVGNQASPSSSAS